MIHLCSEPLRPVYPVQLKAIIYNQSYFQLHSSGRVWRALSAIFLHLILIKKTDKCPHKIYGKKYYLTNIKVIKITEV